LKTIAAANLKLCCCLENFAQIRLGEIVSLVDAARNGYKKSESLVPQKIALTAEGTKCLVGCTGCMNHQFGLPFISSMHMFRTIDEEQVNKIAKKIKGEKRIPEVKWSTRIRAFRS
jgi:hypothetical protein